MLLNLKKVEGLSHYQRMRCGSLSLLCTNLYYQPQIGEVEVYISTEEVNF